MKYISRRSGNDLDACLKALYNTNMPHLWHGVGGQ